MNSSDEGLLAANQRFYTALTGRDVAEMARLWARDHSATCTHPSAQPIYGRGPILESFAAISAGSESPSVRATSERIVARTSESALVTCTERIGDVELAATNGFVLEPPASG